MLRGLDFSSLQGVLTSVLGLAVFMLIALGIRILMMLTIQARQQKMNRQINERLKTLIAAYRTLGGSFTGNLEVDPAHARALRARSPEEGMEIPPDPEAGGPAPAAASGQDLAEDPGVRRPSAEILERRRRIRDAVEAALSDIFLLGTEEHVRLAEAMARDLAEGRTVRTGDLVVSLRDYIRKALGLDPIPEGLMIPQQGPTRPQTGGGARQGRGEGGGSGGGGSGGAGGGMGGGGMGMGLGRRSDDAG